jgi:hypothetical protein
MTTRWLLLAITPILFMACRPDGTKTPGEADSSLRLQQPFPSKERVDAIASGPAPLPPDPVKFASIDTWKLRGPLPTTSGATPATTEDAKALAKILGPERPVTEQMSCFAREIGGLMLAHPDDPPPDLLGWIAARCGVGHIGANLLVAKSGPSGTAKLDASKDRDPILQAAKGVRGPADFGLGIVDDGKSSTMVIAYAPRTTTFADVSMVPSNCRIVVAGESTTPIGWINGYVTRGQDGVGKCVPVAASTTSANAFALSCAVEAFDSAAMIEIAVGRPGQLMGSVELLVWASPDGSLGDTWTAPNVAAPIGDGEVDALAWMTGINAIRERNALKPWSLAKGQSETVDALSPHLFDGDPRTRDEATLGILAGWKVEGSIRDADLHFLSVPSGVPLARSLGAAMRHPTFRAMVMGSDREVGALSLRKHGTQMWDRVVVAGYGLYQPRDYFAEEEAFLDQLDAYRAARNLPPVERVKVGRRIASASPRWRIACARARAIRWRSSTGCSITSRRRRVTACAARSTRR